MSWINRCIAPIFSVALVAGFALPASADAPDCGRLSAPDDSLHPRVHVSRRDDDRHPRSGTARAVARGRRDAGVAAGRSLRVDHDGSAGGRELAVGDRRYDVGPISLQASVAPYQRDGEIYLPLTELLRGLDLALRQDGAMAVLQPQLASLDVRTAGSRADLVAHGGAPLHPRVVQQNQNTIAYEFDGVGTTLTGSRAVNAGGIRTVQISQSGSVRDPKTLLSVQLAPGAVHDVPRSNDDRDVVISFASSATQAQATPAPAAPADATQAQTAPAAAAGGANVTSVTVSPSGDGYVVTIGIAGDAAFEWHRLRDPDNRFWVDVKNAQLQGPAIDQNEPVPVGALRVRQIDPSTVRVALSLAGPKSLSISPTATGLTVDVNQTDVGDTSAMARAGQGSVGSVVSAGEQAAAVTPAPYGGSGTAGTDGTWKFGATARSSYVPKNPRLIVIDPGHGGSDRGSSRHGVNEAALALDMAKRFCETYSSRKAGECG